MKAVAILVGGLLASDTHAFVAQVSPFTERRNRAAPHQIRRCESSTAYVCGISMAAGGKDSVGAGIVAVVTAAVLVATPMMSWADIAPAAPAPATAQMAPDGTAMDDANIVEQLAKEATVEQVKRVRQEEQQTLRETAKREPGSTIATLVVSIKSDAFPLGYPDVSAFPALATDEARLIITAFGKQGPPVAARRLPLKDLKFPVVLDLTDDDLAFPLTKEAWKADARAEDDIGVAVVLDVDGKLATLDSGDLTGYAVSKIIKLGGQAQRTQAAVTVQINRALEERGQAALPREEISVLERIDAQLALKDGEL